MLITTIALAACSQTNPINPSFVTPVSELEKHQDVLNTDAVIAKLDSPTGSTLLLIDEGLAFEDGGVAVLELKSVSQEALLPSLKTIEPTALELFLALAVNEEVPRRLREAHEQTSQRNARALEPRQLDLSSHFEAKLVGELDPYCTDAGSFQNNFHNWFFLGMNYAYEGYGLGLIWKNIGTTAVATRRVLAACVNPRHTDFAESTPVEVKVEAQIAANLWVLIPGTLMTLDIQEGMYYLSEGGLAKRYRIIADAHPWAIYNLAGAWGKANANPSSH